MDMSINDEIREARGFDRALGAALETGAVEVARILLAQKWWAMGGAKLMASAARSAAIRCESVELLLSMPGDWSLALAGSGAVCEAGAAGDWESARLLCQAGSSPDEVGRCRETALWHAVLRTNPKAVAMLLSFGADPSFCPMDRSVSPLRMSMGIGSPASAEAVECIRLLVQSCPDLEEGGAGKRRGEPSLLEYAIQRESVESIEVLARAGADLRRLGRHGETPMDLAMGLRAEACALALLGGGWSPEPSEAGLRSAKAALAEAREKGFAKVAGALSALLDKMDLERSVSRAPKGGSSPSL
jgi:hypothetical protein